LAAFDAGVPAPPLGLTVIDANTAQLAIASNQPAPATVLLSLVSSAGLESNVVPLLIQALADAVFGDGFED
jgi:hypothetical protein